MPSDWANNEARKLAELLDDPERMRVAIAEMLDLSLAGGLLSAAKIVDGHPFKDDAKEGCEDAQGCCEDIAGELRAKAKEIQDAI